MTNVSLFVADGSKILDMSSTGVYENVEYRTEEEVSLDLESLKPYFDRIPKPEADMIELSFFKAKTQEEIAQIWGCTQAAVCYRVRRGIERLRFLVNYPEIDVKKMEEDLVHLLERKKSPSRRLPSKLIARSVTSLYTTTSQTETARLLNLTQCGVRNQLLVVIGLLQRYPDPAYTIYLKALMMVRENVGILHDQNQLGKNIQRRVKK